MQHRSPGIRFPYDLVLAAAASLLISAALPAQAEAALDTQGEMPYQVRTALEGLLQKKVASLRSEKNDEGLHHLRGTFSRNFRKVDASTYQVTFHKDTAGKDQLTTERYLLTLKTPEGKGKWEIASEDLQGSFDGLYRTVPGDEDFFRFDTFHFQREGLKVTASDGSLYRDFLLGRVQRIAMTAHEISYEYTPPLKQDQALYSVVRRRYPADLVFEPSFVFLRCDPITCEDILSSSFTGLRETDRTNLGAELNTKYAEFVNAQEKSRKENPFSGFGLPPEEGRRRFSISLAKGFPEKAVGLNYDSYQPLEVAFWSSEHGPLYAYNSEEVRDSRISAYDLERREDYGARDYDLVALRGTVELALGDAETMSGDLMFSLTTKRELDHLFFRLTQLQSRGEKRETMHPQLIVNSIENENGEELTWVRLGARTGLIVLPETLPAETDLVLRMQFTNKNVIFKFTSTYSYMDRGGWLPFVRFGDKIDLFDLTVKVPSRYTAIGIGHKISETTEDGVNITRWTAESAVDFPTVIFGVYEEGESTFKANKSDGTEIPVRVHLDKDAISMYEMSPKFLSRIADEAANSLNLYREISGVDYPYGKLDLVNDPLGFLYGQSPASIVYLGTGAFFGEGTLAEIGGSNITKFNKSLVAHEVAHQWWGSLIGNANQRNYWFIESLAEYSSALYIEARYGARAYREHVDSWRRNILDTKPTNSVQAATYLWSDGGYQAAVYAKGPYAFHVLRETVGDERFFAFLKNLAQELEGESIVTRDIQRVAEKSFGGGMEWFFDQWIRGVAMPELTLNYTTRAAEDGSYIIEGEVEQKLVLGKAKDEEVLDGEFFQGIVPITIEMKKGAEARLPVVLKGVKTPFQFKIPQKPRKVVFNKYGEILAQKLVVKGSS